MTTTMSTTPMATRTMTTSTMTAPARGGINLTIARIELRRMLRNKRTMIFTLVFPVVMFLFIAAQVTGQDDSMGVGVRATVGAYIMASMAIYGAIMATTSAGPRHGSRAGVVHRLRAGGGLALFVRPR
ncbi:hypothetical protein [Nostocoides australiense]